LQLARQLLEVAELVAEERDDEAALVYSSASASLAVLAGIAASDAASCAALQKRSRSQNHRDAATLLEQIEPDGKKAAGQLRDLLNLKDTAQYGFLSVADKELAAAIRRATLLTDFAERIVQR
jgi:hypothetical protein